ncbi:MAG: ferrous iron transport protein B [Tidjanibacter sp.]|nr:ferrous iron transport protein B [Tidjanibacter sp.]
MKLSELKNGEKAVIVKVAGHGGFRKRIMEMGFVRGVEVRSVQDSPMHDPVKYTVMGYDVSLRRSEAEMIEVLPHGEANRPIEPAQGIVCNNICESCAIGSCGVRGGRTLRKNEINVALVGNPNSGKTSLFNILSGSSEHVGNYSGVTVDAKLGKLTYKGYRINITDLPGTYSLSAYTPEEVYVRKHLYEAMPDVILNTVVASNLERNLYLTSELIDLNLRTVVALNMYDELQQSGGVLDYKSLGAMIGIPLIPTIAKTGYGIEALLDAIIELFEGRNSEARHVHINYGTSLEEEIRRLSASIRDAHDLPKQFPVRYWAIKLLEGDSEAAKMLSACKDYPLWKEEAKSGAARVSAVDGSDIETILSDRKYGFIAGALEETLHEKGVDFNRRSRRIDRLVVNKWIGFPLFILLMWLMFWATFTLGGYPQEWIESGFGWLGEWLWSVMPDGALRDLVVNGIVGGVGSVAVFLPNILILYFFISLMEDSGYMARAAFIMDKLMHRMGLHGKSFIPLLMGFGCNVPAIMATRTIESRSSRLITILVTPFVSCSARLPVFLLLAGTFFPHNAATVLIGLYLLGILVAFLTARLLRATKFKKDETPFVMELPPYRMPTVRATLTHMWDKCYEYIRKIATTILLATILIWALSYYPRPKEEVINSVVTTEVVAEATTEAPTTLVIGSSQSPAQPMVVKTEVAVTSKTDRDITTATAAATSTPNSEADRYAHSYLGQIGRFIEPVMRPLGLDWRAGIALLSSTPAKELVVSTMAVLYGGDDISSLSKNITANSGITPASAVAFMIFILLFFPCIGTLATIKAETGSAKWMWFTAIYNTLIAWVLARIAYLLCGLIL